MNTSLYDYLERPKSCSPDDFWGQVRRTVNGQAVSQDQIDIIFSMIREAMSFQAADVLLDLACGNGRLCFEFFDEICGYLGVDHSPYLIDVGKKNFQRGETHVFVESDLSKYLVSEPHPEKFTKALCYSSCAYFADKDLESILETIYRRFEGVQRFFLGSLPDASQADRFFEGREKLPLNDPTSAIGRWFERESLTRLCERCGWSAEMRELPPGFYQSRFRFNALLTRRK